MSGIIKRLSFFLDKKEICGNKIFKKEEKKDMSSFYKILFFHVYKLKTDIWLDDASPTGRQVWETWARF